jgi:hypothetical protein
VGIHAARQAAYGSADRERQSLPEHHVAAAAGGGNRRKTLILWWAVLGSNQ